MLVITRKAQKEMIFELNLFQSGLESLKNVNNDTQILAYLIDDRVQFISVAMLVYEKTGGSIEIMDRSF